VDPLSFLHPELRETWLAIRRWETLEPGTELAPGAAEMWFPEDWSTRTIPGPADGPDFQVIVHGAKPGSSRPGILHIHGGGFVTGMPVLAAGMLKAIAAEIDCVIVSVDYRLAPATPFPGALDDNYAALLWMHANAQALGIDTARVAVMGESAGGAHAAMLTHWAGERGEVPIAFQALIYPMLDDRTRVTENEGPASAGTWLWTPQSNLESWSALLGVPAGSANVPVGAVPARTRDLSGMPPTYIGVGSIDFLAAEDITYAQRLIDAGVLLELNVVPGAFHGFDIFAPDAAVTRAFRQSAVRALANALSAG
jgi:acetyl esterase/lipase